ncbi:MAG: tripartite tricarboxylate transporter substrate binding protein BugD [Xanthobacteraceae bacterium]|nr:tripartite tricarboxylate transporter substrate binding protein BugD [Xanthobacteraceae bacterium]
MRVWGAAAFAILALSQSGTSAVAQNWPTRAVTMVVPFAPGGGTDVLGRIVAKRLSETLGQQVVVENVGGAGGMMGSARVVKSPPDGYQFVLGSRADAINQTLYKTPLYNLMNDLEPVVLVADQPTVMVARKDLPVNGLQEFIAYTKANQAKMQFGSAGAGSTGFIDCALFNAAIGLNITHVPYRGGGPAMQDLIGGRIDYFCTLSGTAVPQIESGLIKAIAVMTKDRAPMLPNLPSTFEQGFKDFEASTWFGFYVPKGTPAAVIKRLRDATVEALDTSSVQEQLLKSGSLVSAPDRRSTEYLRKFTESEIAKNGAPIKAAGISME